MLFFFKLITSKELLSIFKWSMQDKQMAGGKLTVVLYDYWHLCLFADGHKHKKSLRRKLDSLSKEKNKEKGNVGWAGYFPDCGECKHSCVYVYVVVCPLNSTRVSSFDSFRYYTLIIWCETTQNWWSRYPWNSEWSESTELWRCLRGSFNSHTHCNNLAGK